MNLIGKHRLQIAQAGKDKLPLHVFRVVDGW
jgi:hypothetical protein